MTMVTPIRSVALVAALCISGCGGQPSIEGASLSFTRQPTDGVAGQALASIAVTLRDADGNTLTSPPESVTLSLGASAAGAELRGTTTTIARDGVAVFSDLVLERAGADYTLVASATGRMPVESDSFDISAAAAAHLRFRTQPAEVMAGAAIVPAPEVELEDAYGNPTGATQLVTLSLGENPSNGVLSGTTTRPAASGVASFSDLAIDIRGAGYTLVAASDGFAPATSDPFDVKELSEAPRPELWVIGESPPASNPTAVYAVAEADGIIYLGGTFDYVGPQTGGFALLDATTGAPGRTRIDGSVQVIPDGAGGWYIGGSLEEVNGIPRFGIARLTPSGDLDDSFDANVDGFVTSLALAGDILYLGGGFDGVDGQPRNNLAAVDARTGAVTPWNPNADGDVRAIAVSGSTVYVGGRFTMIGGQYRHYLAAVDASTGAVTSWAPEPYDLTYPGWVYSLVVSGDVVYAGGLFTNIGGQPRGYLAAVDKNTAAATPWNPNASAYVSAIAVAGGLVYAAGDFTSIGGQARNRIAALDARTGAATAWDPDANRNVHALAVSDRAVYAAGQFTRIGGQDRNRIAALDPRTGAATSWNPNASQLVDSLAVAGDTVAAGGDFNSIGGQTRKNLAAFDARTGAATAWNPRASGAVRALAVSGATIYMGGDFSAIGEEPRYRLAAVDARTGTATAWGPGAGSRIRSVSTLSLAGDIVYLAGDFTAIADQPRAYLAALDKATGAPTAWNPDADNVVRTLLVSGTTIYAGGAFTRIGGQPRNHIAALDAGTGAATSWNPDANYSVNALVRSGDTIYAGGSFYRIGGQPRSLVAALDATTGSPTDWHPALGNQSVYALALSGGTLYAGGDLEYREGAHLKSLAAVDTSSGRITAWSPQTCGGRVFALQSSGQAVHAGGDFLCVGRGARPGIASFEPTAMLRHAWRRSDER